MIQAENPFAAPSTDPVKREVTDAERIRKEMIDHETSVRSIGSLMILGAILGAFGGLAAMGAGIVEVLVLLVFVVANGVCGFLLRRLDPRSRLPAAGLSAIGLIGFPIVTLLSAYFLYLLLSKKGAYVFTPEYAEIRAATPHVKPRTPWIAIGAFVLLVVAVLLAIALPSFIRR